MCIDTVDAQCRERCAAPKFLKQMHPVVPGAENNYILRDAALVIAACGIVSISFTLETQSYRSHHSSTIQINKVKINWVLWWRPSNHFKTISALKRSKASSSTTSSTTFTIPSQNAQFSPISPANHPRPHWSKSTLRNGRFRADPTGRCSALQGALQRHLASLGFVARVPGFQIPWLSHCVAGFLAVPSYHLNPENLIGTY